jgi:RNA-directed DNA polymerase
MASYKNLYPQICDFENHYVAYRRARCGKRERAAVASFEFDLERNLLQLQSELQSHTHAPSGYTNLHIHGWAGLAGTGRRVPSCLPPGGTAGG